MLSTDQVMPKLVKLMQWCFNTTGCSELTNERKRGCGGIRFLEVKRVSYMCILEMRYCNCGFRGDTWGGRSLLGPPPPPPPPMYILVTFCSTHPPPTPWTWVSFGGGVWVDILGVWVIFFVGVTHSVEIFMRQWIIPKGALQGVWEFFAYFASIMSNHVLISQISFPSINFSSLFFNFYKCVYR